MSRFDYTQAIVASTFNILRGRIFYISAFYKTSFIGIISLHSVNIYTYFGSVFFHNLVMIPINE